MMILQGEFIIRYKFQALAESSASSNGVKLVTQVLSYLAEQVTFLTGFTASAAGSASTLPSPTPEKAEWQEEHVATGPIMLGSVPSWLYTVAGGILECSMAHLASIP